MSDLVTMSEHIGINDPKIKAIAKRVLSSCILSVQKATMHTADARSFPMPADPNALEHLLHQRLTELDSARRAGAVARVRAHLAAGAPAQSALVGPELANVNLHDTSAISEHVARLPFPKALHIAHDELHRPRALHGPSGLIPLQSSTRLGFRIHKVKCVDETDPEWFGDDEIAMGGVTVDETGDTGKVPEFSVRNDFDDGEQQVYSPPKEFTVFSLLEGTAWPRCYFVTLVLAEKDMGGLSDFLNKLVEKVRSQVVAALIKALGGAFGTSGGPVGAIIGAAVAWVVGNVFEWLKSWWSDDVFPPKTISISVPSQNATFAGGSKDTPEATVTFTGHGGTYAVTYDWILKN